jgi:hypothetical protein
MADEDKINTEGRQQNAAQPLNAADDKGGPERYPPVRQDDGVEVGESRSFDPNVEAPTPRQGAGDGSAPPAKQEGNLGPEGDPVEGKR